MAEELEAFEVRRLIQTCGYLLARLLLRSRRHRYSPLMSAARRVLITVRVVRGSLRRWQPQTYWQVWMSAGGLSLAGLVIEISLWPVFHTWPQLDVYGTACIALVGIRQSLALRGRRRAREPSTIAVHSRAARR